MQPVAAFALQERVWFRVSLLFSLFFLLGGGGLLWRLLLGLER